MTALEVQGARKAEAWTTMSRTGTLRRAFLSARDAATAVGVPATAALAQHRADNALEASWVRWRALYANSNRI